MASRELNTNKKKMSCCKVIQKFVNHDSGIDSPIRGGCCHCNRKTFVDILMNVSHPCDYWCEICLHIFTVEPISSPQIYKACQRCLHSCISCCGGQAPKVYSIELECGTCHTHTTFTLTPSRDGHSWEKPSVRAARAWGNLFQLITVNEQRWNHCVVCGYDPAPYWPPVKLHHETFQAYAVRFDKVSKTCELV